MSLIPGSTKRKMIYTPKRIDTVARLSLVAVEQSHVTPMTSGHTTNLLVFSQTHIFCDYLTKLKKYFNKIF